MTTKWNLINLDLVSHHDKLSSEREEGKEGKLFFKDAFSPPTPTPPSSQVEKAKGRMGSDSGPAPVE